MLGNGNVNALPKTEVTYPTLFKTKIWTWFLNQLEIILKYREIFKSFIEIYNAQLIQILRSLSILKSNNKVIPYKLLLKFSFLKILKINVPLNSYNTCHMSVFCAESLVWGPCSLFIKRNYIGRFYLGKIRLKKPIEKKHRASFEHEKKYNWGFSCWCWLW